MTTELIKVSNLSRSFTRGDEVIPALRQVNLSFKAGEFVAITGASGSGKSTFMYILGLIDRQDSGQYELFGRSTDELSDDQHSQIRNQTFGFVFQTFHLLPRATALRNASMPLEYSRAYGVKISDSEVKARALKSLAMVGLSERAMHLPNQLSGGQRQRVAIARALINNPAVIFADEPTGNLDSKTAKEILNLFTELNREGRTIILVTHDPSVAAVAKRRISMQDGQILEDSDARH